MYVRVIFVKNKSIINIIPFREDNASDFFGVRPLWCDFHTGEVHRVYISGISGLHILIKMSGLIVIIEQETSFSDISFLVIKDGIPLFAIQ